ncbi:MAG: hypothetical protein E7Z80_04975 [Methanobrevibacter thaueri]|nr:hypothetical protein [Methanobrevibacter thaueri]
MNKKPRKIKQKEYKKIKKTYLTKTQSLRTIYLETNRKTYIDKKTFIKIINKIRIKEGYPEFTTKRDISKKYRKYNYLKPK